MVLNTLVVDVESETLLNKERKPKSLRGLVAGAAAASFVLGLVAATAVSTLTNPAAPPAALHARAVTTRSAPPAALHAKKPNTKLGVPSGGATYLVNIACIDSSGKEQWTSKDLKTGTWHSNNYPKELHGGYSDNFAATPEFDYVETSEYLLDHQWSSQCAAFDLTVAGPEGQGFRAYESDGTYLGSFDADDIDSGNNRARIRNLNANPTINQGKDVADPWALKTSVFLHEPGTGGGGMAPQVQGNRYLLVSIDFKPKSPRKATGHHCIIDHDVKSDGVRIKSGKVQGCDISPPAYSCDGSTMYYQGSLRNLADGQPIDVEFRNGATLEFPLNNLQFDYHLNVNGGGAQQECFDLCAWAQGKKKWYDSMTDCYAVVESRSVNDAGLGPLRIYGEGKISSDGIWANMDNWPQDDRMGWNGQYNDQTSSKDKSGKNTNFQLKQVMKGNEWYVLGGIVDILQDKEWPSLKHVEYGLEIDGISFATMPRGDGAIVHNQCGKIQDPVADYDRYKNCMGLNSKGALLKNINYVSWLGTADGPNLASKHSKIDTSFLMSADDVIHVSASDFSAWKNVLITGNAGAAVMLGSYNMGLNDPKIERATVDGVFIARASRGNRNDAWANEVGLVDTMSCMENGPLELKGVTVRNLAVAGLGPDSNGHQLQQVDRLFSISANAAQANGENFCWANGGSVQPVFDITLENFYVKEKNLVDWQWDSNQCNYIASGKPSWSVTLKGSDLESQKGKMCPF